MADADVPQSEPGHPLGAAPSGSTGEPRRAPPGYDAEKEGYTGISDGALNDPSDVRAARDFAEMIVDTVREGLLVLDLDFCVKAANESFYATFGVAPEETVGRLVYDLGNGQWDLPELRKLLEDILPRDNVFNDYEVEHTFDGIGRRVMLLNARRLNDHHLILLAIEDATERRQGEQVRRRETEKRTEAEEALRQSEERLRLIADSLPVLISYVDAEHCYQFTSKTYEQWFGVSPEEIAGKPVRDVVGEEAYDMVLPRLDEALGGETVRFEARVDYPMLGVRDVSAVYVPHVHESGETAGLFALVTDVTEQKQAEAALRENEERLLRAQQAARVGTWDIDLMSGTVTWSEGVFDLVGLPPEAGVPSAQSWASLLHPEDRERVERDVLSAIADGGAYTNEFRVVRSDGEVVWVAAKGHVLRDGAGRPARLLGANYDITERKEAEEALRRLNETLEERVESRTRLVRRHERRIRELSRALALAEQEERRRIAHVLHDDLQQVLFAASMAADTHDAHRLSALLNEAMTLTRTLSHELSPPFLEGENVEDLLEWLAVRKRERYGLEVEVEVGGGVPVPDPAVRVLLYQLLRELLFNVAKHADTDRARVVVEQVGGHVHIVVEDEGAGFDPNTLKRPKKVGLGLSSVRERLELVGGHLVVISKPGEGTRVTVSVPFDEPPDT